MNKFSIIFDFRFCQNNLYRGVGRYSVDLMKSFINMFRYKYDFFLFVDYHHDIPVLDFDVQFICEDDLSYYQLTKHFDVYFCCNFFDPLISFPPINKKIASVSKIVTGLLYDLIPLVYAGNYLFADKTNNGKNLIVKYSLGLSSLRFIDHIFAISESTKNDYIKYFGESSNKITTVYGGIDNKFYINQLYDFKSRKNNLIYVAGNEERKNYVNLVIAFEQALVKKNIPEDSVLYIVCRVNQYFISKCKSVLVHTELLDRNIIITGFIEDSEMISLIKEAKCSIFPSYYEGLGLPILESYAIGTPVFASNFSSTKELVCDECGFNPHNIESIEKAIYLGLCNENICNLSLEFGQRLLSRINWDNTCECIDEQLNILLKKYKKPVGVTALYGCLPPNKSGIAEYNKKIIEHNKFQNLVFVSDFDNCSDFKILNNNKTLLFSIDSLSYLKNKFSFKKNIIILGNSIHNLPYLRLALNDLRYDNEKFLLLHEVNLIGLWMCYFNNDIFKLKKFCNKWYADRISKLSLNKVSNFGDLYELLRQNFIFFIRPLLRLSNSKNVIVHNQEACALLRKELTHSEFNSLNIKVLFHAIEQIDSKNELIEKNNNHYTIGTFGFPQNGKFTDTIIKAVDYLNKNYFSVDLVVAGYSAEVYIKSINGGRLPEFVKVYTDPSTTELHRLMMSTDLSVQLRRYPTNGESSGIICNLISLKRKVLINKSFLNNQADLTKDYFYVIDDNFDSIILAENIKEILLSKQYKNNKDYLELSYENYIAQLFAE